PGFDRLSPDAGAPEDRVLLELALEARRRPVAGIQRGRGRQAKEPGADAHHLPAQVGLRHLAADAAGQDRVAHKRMIGDQEADAPGSMAGRVQHLDLELAELELVAVEEVAVGRAQELLGVGRMNAGLSAGCRLHVVFAGHVAGVSMGGKDVLDREAGGLLDDLLWRQARVDDHGFFRGCVRHDVTVDLALELDLEDRQLRHQSLFTGMERAAVVAFGIALLLVCLFWTYGYLRRRSKKRY